MFKLFNNIPKVYFDPNDTANIFGKEDIFAELSKDDDKPADDDKIELDITDKTDKVDDDKTDKGDKKDKKETKKDEKDKEDVETKEDDDLEALEAELEDDDSEPDDEKLELVAPVRRKEILKKYPKLFEDFPYLERAYYREQQFTEINPTLDDARETKAKANSLDAFESDLSEGNIEKVLSGVKQNGGQGFNKLVDNLLVTLQKVDPQAHTHVIGNVISHTIYAMVQEARESKNEALQNAAQILNQFIFASSKYVPPSKLTTEEKTDPATKQLEDQKQQFLKQRYDVASGELRTKVSNTIKSAINQHIDPNNSMPEYVRKNAERDAFENVHEMLAKDNRFKAIVDKLWEKAAKDNFSINSMNDIRKAFLGRGKMLLPTAIKKARLEALKGMRPSTKAKDTDDTDIDDKTEKVQIRPKSQPNKSGDKSTDKYKGMTTLEALMVD